jgi:hypothetical protein
MNYQKLKYRPAAKGHNRYCGPGALSILLQIDTQEAALRLRKWRIENTRQSSPSIKGTYDREMIDVLIEGGKAVYKRWGSAQNIEWAQDHHTLTGPTLNQWLSVKHSDGVYLVSAGHHWFVIAVRGNRRYYSDNNIGEWVNARTDKRVSRRARMQTAYKVA